MKTSFNRVRKSVAVVALAATMAAGLGIVAANAEVATGFGVTATTSPGAPGQGSLTLVTDPGFPASVTVTVFVVGTGGTLAGGVFEQPVTLDGAPASVTYNCVGSSMELGVRFPGKTGPTLPVSAPCGVVVAEPPAASWNQTASIIPGRAGSGNATVEFNNTGSNRDAVFYVTFDGGEPTSATTVAAGQTSSIPIQPGPGTVVRVFGTQDGSAPPKKLAELELPKKAPASDVIWGQTASIIPGPDGSGNATVEFNNTGSNRDGVFYVTVDGGEPTSAKLVSAGQVWSTEIRATPGAILRVFGTKDGSATPEELKKLTLPMAPAVSNPPDTQPAPEPAKVPVTTPVVPAAPVAPAASQPSAATNSVPLANVSANVPAQTGEQRFSFDTAVPSQGVSPWTAVGYVMVTFATIFMIGFVIVRRRAA